MNFRRIEYLFIIAFLLLDVFLVYVFAGKNMPVLESGTESSNVNIVQEMQADEITASSDFSENSEELPMVAGEVDSLSQQPTHNIASVSTDDSGKRTFVQLVDPVYLPLQGDTANSTQPLSDEAKAVVDGLLKDGTVVNGEDYQFIMYDDTKNGIYYGCQTSMGHPVVDETAQLIFHLNDQGEVVSYEQTHVSNIIVQGDNRSLISQQEAVENLYLSNGIPAKSKIVDVSLGYQNTLTEENTILYRPVWRILIKKPDNTLTAEIVDGINGSIVQSTQQELQETT